MLEWGVVVDYGIDHLAEIVDINENDCIIYEWPFILPVARMEGLSKAGFYIV